MLGFLLRGHYRQINELFVGHMDAIPEPHVQLGADRRTLILFHEMYPLHMTIKVHNYMNTTTFINAAL